MCLILELLLASFAPLVIRAWQRVDVVAENIIQQNAERLALLVHTAAKKSPKASADGRQSADPE